LATPAYCGLDSTVSPADGQALNKAMLPRLIGRGRMLTALFVLVQQAVGHFDGAACFLAC